MTLKPLALSIAWRYLWAPKSHGAVNAISIISVAGVAVATAAIIIVLSVFNGFELHLNARMSTLTPDVSVTPSKGKTFTDADSVAKRISEIEGVELAMPALTDNALVISDNREMPITLKGVDPARFARITALDSLLMDGTPTYAYPPKTASIAVGVAQRLGITSAGGELTIFAPRRLGRVNLANPISSFMVDSVKIGSVFRSLENEFDENTVICDIATVRGLLQYDTEASSIEVKAAPGINPQALAASISETLGDSFTVKDRIMLQDVNFRMVSIEKWITFLLLTFILVIASFNIISTLSMLIIEKERSIKTLVDLGMNRSRIGRIFWWESVLVTLSGALIGLGAGIILCVIQQEFGIIKLAGDPESLVILSYPVKLKWLDVGATFVPITVIGLIAAWISYAFARSQTAVSRLS